MDITDVPEALAERLGHEAAHGLVTLLDKARAEWAEDVLTTAADRFDRQLTIEMSALRVDFARQMSAFRQDVTKEMSALRQDMTKEMADLRQGMTSELSVLRQDMTRELSALRQEFTRDVSGVRVELLKWSFVFWVGQVAAMAGLVAFMRSSI